MKVLARMRLVLLLPLLFLLAACGHDESDVRQWMQEVRSQAKPGVPPLAEPKRFQPYVYEQQAAVDPFNPIKLQVALSRQQENSGGKLRPDLNRRKEALEAYALDGLKMVGTLQKDGRMQALIEVDKLLFRVGTGNYMGQNFGMVTRITEGAVELREVVQDPGGVWVERKARLELQEKK